MECSSKFSIPKITISTLIVNAQNDPFLHPSCFPYETCRESEAVYFENPYDGGHQGFMKDRLVGTYWSEERAVEFLEDEKIYSKTQAMQNDLMPMMQEVADVTGKLQRVRGIGGMVAADLQADPSERLGWQVYQNAIKLGAILRPLGNTIYWLPPLNTELQTLRELKEITIAAITDTV